MSHQLAEVPLVRADSIAVHVLAAMDLVQLAERSVDSVTWQQALARAQQALDSAEIARRAARMDILTGMPVNGAVAYVRQHLSNCGA